MGFEIEKAEDVQNMINEIVDILGNPHIIGGRIICVRSWGSKAYAYARIWSMPKVWQVALDIHTFYVIEVLSEHFDKLDYEEKIKVLIHELMHIPKTFSGALLPHKNPGKKINDKNVNELYKIYKQRTEKYGV
ncbi:metallopeptidase [Candidatus Micrarchaeota archaeon]|jgi:predicted metallopeptidase|nr:metallopeptidase [Candidatus Micrarchaeota archaeon]